MISAQALLSFMEVLKILIQALNYLLAYIATTYFTM